jgi:cytidyltransferase-like protein
MGLSYVEIFEQLLKEVDTKNVGLFPGKFKPPHIGHFKTCEIASKENDIVFVLISSKEHEGITAEKSFNIWSIYKNYLPNIFPFIVTPTPVLACYDIANILNNGEYKPTKTSQTPKSNAPDIIESNKELSSYLSVGNNINLNLYSSKEDQSRFKNINTNVYKGKGIIQINLKPIARIASASNLRLALSNNQRIDSFLPKVLKSSDKSKIINILR